MLWKNINVKMPLFYPASSRWRLAKRLGIDSYQPKRVCGLLIDWSLPFAAKERSLDTPPMSERRQSRLISSHPKF
jgi:hypothetical protein